MTRHCESKMKINVFLQVREPSCVSWDGKGTFMYDCIDQFLSTNANYFILFIFSLKEIGRCLAVKEKEMKATA